MRIPLKVFAVLYPPAEPAEGNAIYLVQASSGVPVDIYIADAIGYTRYLESLQPIQRISSEDMAGAGFTALKYFGVGSSADFVLDNGYCTAKTVYALNTDYIYLRPAEDRRATIPR